jgi:hypothetical protein
MNSPRLAVLVEVAAPFGQPLPALSAFAVAALADPLNLGRGPLQVGPDLINLNLGDRPLLAFGGFSGALAQPAPDHDPVATGEGAGQVLGLATPHVDRQAASELAEEAVAAASVAEQACQQAKAAERDAESWLSWCGWPRGPPCRRGWPSPTSSRSTRRPAANSRSRARLAVGMDRPYSLELFGNSSRASATLMNC